MTTSAATAALIVLYVSLTVPGRHQHSGPELTPETTAPALPTGFLTAPTVIEGIDGTPITTTTTAVAPVGGTAGGSRAQGKSPGHPGSPALGAPAAGTPAQAVRWTISGSCTARATSYSCRITIAASNGLLSGGYIGVFPGTGPCRSAGPLVNDSVTIDGTCPRPYGPAVRAVYSLLLAPNSSVLASVLLPWTPASSK